MKEKTLVILAAGLGSRFGGLKQIEVVGPNNEFIIDYSIYDAIRSGFNKVIFIIKKENYNIFKETIGNRISKYVKVEYVFQELNDIPNKVEIPVNRVKPFGTAHALYCARNSINGPFAVISSDDFYGLESFKLLSESLDKNENSIIGFEVKNTINKDNSVKRGIIFEDENNNILSIKESKVNIINNTILCDTLDEKEHFEIEDNHPVTMLIDGFQKDFIYFLNKDIVSFFENNKDNLNDCEYFLPDVITNYSKNHEVKVIHTSSKWFGVTYKEDMNNVKSNISSMIDKGIYKSNLWS